MNHKQRLTLVNVRLKLGVVRDRIVRREQTIETFTYRRLVANREDLEPPPVELNPPCYWSDWREDFELETSFTLPPDWQPPVTLELPFDSPRDFNHPEALVYLDGGRLAALDRQHHRLNLPDTVLDGAEHRLTLRGWTGIGWWLGQPDGVKPFLPRSTLTQRDPATEKLYDTATLLLKLAAALGETHPAYGRLLNVLVEHFGALDTREPISASFYSEVPAVLDALETAAAGCGWPLDVDVIGVGHAHIDVAWLWPLAQTRQKTARTFSNVLSLMTTFPDFHFSQSQPQLYRYVEEDTPDIFAELKQRVQEGRWEVLGPAWVEMDANLTGAESLVRQLLIGKTYLDEHVGPYTPVAWLPDCFGFPASLPQLFADVGMRALITTKLSWNQYNEFPYDTFWWRGIDGTRLLSHFITTPEQSTLVGGKMTYNGDLSPDQIVKTWEGYKQKAENTTLLTVYGHGDGGGGPTREMLAQAQLLKSAPGSPRLTLGTVAGFLERLHENAAAYPEWQGELYLETHRGTYTSQATVKRNNRKAEVALHDAEFLCSVAALLGAPYPHAALRDAWTLLCLQQFHDILPGSSIAPVYRESERDFERIFGLAQALSTDALEVIGRQQQGDVLVWNSTGFAAETFVLLPTLPPGAEVRADGRTLATQVHSSGTLVAVTCGSYSICSLEITGDDQGVQASDDVRAGHVAGFSQDQSFVLENALVRAVIDRRGVLTSLFSHVLEREMLTAEGNDLQVFEDRSETFDAWDINIYFDDKSWPFEPATDVRLDELGPLRASVHFTRAYRGSTLEQSVFLRAGSARLDFETTVDWREQHQLLKVAFPVAVQSAAASYHIQWGVAERPTHRNTSWDWARFEVPAHYWADLSQSDGGVSLLNDCKYGYDVQGNVLRLTLLKSATSPDPEADQGTHRFTYSVLPHAGSWRTETVREGYSLNHPVRTRRQLGGGTPRDPLALVAVTHPGVVVETLKEAEDGRGLIVRLYETHGAHAEVILETALKLAAVWRCNLMEVDEQEVSFIKSSAQLSFTPFQIVTLRLVGELAATQSDLTDMLRRELTGK